MKINNHWRIILIATLFNLAFEYSLRGSTALTTRPLLFISLFLTYLTLYTMVEDLIVRFRLKDYQVLLFTSIYMMVYMGFMTGSLFDKAYFLGINPVNLVFVGILWSGIIQGPLTLYFANRISPRDWSHPKMEKFGWLICLIITAVVWLIHYVNPYKAKGTPLGYLSWAILEGLAILILYQTVKTVKKEGEERKFVSSPILDFLAFGTFFIFIFSILFLTSGQMISVASEVNRPALRLVNIWTLILSAIFVVYRFLIRKKEVTV